ncbi:MAG: alpha-1,4-glucan--maltose-1-phosphate maltosyltransferase, partial [Actinomycetes bacterium]|nr:alpha-1,4-glucan--maltose-1-phosphate maltosyltransferase [Actinomycetes bacterium]MDX5398464.1 alpha-1,4-glucan--maltose-1-phosphate maltosyltransferase [Actinomycetes bacterium]
VLAYSKRIDAAFSPTGEDDTVLVVVNLDPFLTHESLIYLDMEALGLVGNESFRVIDELNGLEHHWGPTAWVRLDPRAQTAHIMSVKPL